ncbi:GntR family transcriptional regulator [Pigmentiphaga soli]|uniref:GntR family transcriptional regulator n=1 Tax=Pigmentiphaga soli TaxID=1007095 RepID=A0ABP8H3I5_9BURK
MNSTPPLPGAPARRRGRAPGAPLYRKIADALMADIAAGVYPVGSLLPTEAEFGERFGTGRHTVRDALRCLSDEGIILRRPGSGSTVIASGPRRRFVQSVSNFDQWFNYPADVRRQHVESAHVVADRALAAQLGVEDGSAWLRIGALRSAPSMKAPLCWVDIYVAPRLAAVTRERDHEVTPVHEQIERVSGERIAEVEVEISVGRVPERLASMLAAEPGSSALCLVRRYASESGELLQVTATVHPENRYVYAMKFRRETRR